MSLKLTSSAFENEGFIPETYSRDGGNISPPLAWTGVPLASKSLVLIMDSPDEPSGPFMHWLLYQIPPSVTNLDEGRPDTPKLENGIRQGRNGYGEYGYTGPHTTGGARRYVFHLYALDSELQLPVGASGEELHRAIQDLILEKDELTGRYQPWQRTLKAG